MAPKRLLPLFLLASALASSGGLTARPHEGYKVYHLNYSSADQFLHLYESLSKNGEVDFWSKENVMVSPGCEKYFLKQLEEYNITWEIFISNVQVTIDAERKSQTEIRGSRSGSFNRYYSYREIQQHLSEIARRYPAIVSLGSIGSSYEGRNLTIVKISSEGSGNRPVILVDAGIHAREWIAPAMALYIIQQLVENPSNTDLIANVDWHIIPLLNPDGYEFSYTTSRFWRKTRSAWKGGCRVRHGVDANRNFGFHWNEVGGSSDPCSEMYVGPKPFSEPETVALRDYLKAQQTPESSRIALYLTLHSYGQFFLYPWGYSTWNPPNESNLRELASKANSAQRTAGGGNYAIGTSANALYPAAGGSDDWAMAIAGVPLVFCVELPGGGIRGFDMPPSSISSTVTTFWPAIRVMGEHIRELGAK